MMLVKVLPAFLLVLCCLQGDGFLGAIIILLAQEPSWEHSSQVQLCWAEEIPWWV